MKRDAGGEAVLPFEHQGQGSAIWQSLQANGHVDARTWMAPTLAIQAARWKIAGVPLMSHYAPLTYHYA